MERKIRIQARQEPATARREPLLRTSPLQVDTRLRSAGRGAVSTGVAATSATPPTLERARRLGHRPDRLGAAVRSLPESLQRFPVQDGEGTFWQFYAFVTYADFTTPHWVATPLADVPPHWPSWRIGAETYVHSPLRFGDRARAAPPYSAFVGYPDRQAWLPTRFSAIRPQWRRDQTIGGAFFYLSPDPYEHERFGTGLAGESAQKAFAQGAGSLDWTNLDAAAKVRSLLRLANQQLAALGVPPCGLGTARLPPTILGLFDETTWEIQFNQERLEKGGSPVDLAGASDTVYHECRHAEQWFRVARLMAGRRLPAPRIAAISGIARGVAFRAQADPLYRRGGVTREVQEAEAWYRSLVGEDAEERRATVRGVVGLQREQNDIELELESLKSSSVTLSGHKLERTFALQERADVRERLGLASDNRDLWAEIDRTVGSTPEAKCADFDRRTLDPIEVPGPVGAERWAAYGAAIRESFESLQGELARAELVLAAKTKKVEVLLQELKEQAARSEGLRERVGELNELFRVADAKYHELPEEKDAWKVGAEIEARIKSPEGPFRPVRRARGAPSSGLYPSLE